MNSDLGLFKDYGHYIISLCLISYAALYTYLCNDYGPIDE